MSQRRFLLFSLIISFIIFTICLIPYQILLSFLLFFVILCFYLKFELKEIQRTGLFPYIPENIRQILLTRSLFDILCDIWYIPSFSLYLKIFLRPFVYQIRPEEAIENLSELSQTQRDKALMKGVINLFPNTVQNIIIPKKQILAIEDTKPIAKSDKKEDKTPNPQNESMLSNESTMLEDLEKKLESMESEEEEEKFYFLRPESKFPCEETNQISTNCVKKFENHDETDCIARKMNNINFFNFDKEELIDNKKFVYELFDQPSESEAKVFRRPNKIQKKPTNSYVVADKKSLKKEQEGLKGTSFMSFTTQVLASSKKIAQINLMEQMKKACEKSKEKWDRLENFLENKFNSKKIFGEQNLKPAFRIPLSLIKKFQEFKNSGLNIQKKPIMKLFVGSNLLLALLFLISKRSRGWLVHSLLALLYGLGFVLSTGSLACFVMKYFWQNKRKEIKSEEKK